MISKASYVQGPDCPAPVRYAVAVGVAVAAAAVRGLLAPIWGDSSPFLMFIPAIVLSAWAGGIGPGIVTTVLGALFANYFWLRPLYSLSVSSLQDVVGLLIFVAIGAVICLLSDAMYRGRRRLETLLHSIDAGFVVFDADWRYRYVNERAAELLRQPAASLVGRAIWDVFPDIVGTEIEQSLRRTSVGHQPVEFETLYRPHGRWFRTRVFLTPEGFSALLEDTTGRKQAEEASQRLAAIVRSSDEAIVGQDLEEDEVLSRLRRGEAIEDMETVDLVATILRRAEAEARPCSSPPEALAVLRSWKPHVLISDIEMPGEDGYSLIRRVRELSGHEGGQIPAVALTAYGRPEDRVRSLSAGYSMHVAKPVDPVELGVIVANLAGRSLAG